MSGAPICNGMMKFVKPYARGGATRNIMIEPCIVNSELYCSCDTKSRPGRASSARISMAMKPAARKKPNDVQR